MLIYCEIDACDLGGPNRPQDGMVLTVRTQSWTSHGNLALKTSSMILCEKWDAGVVTISFILKHKQHKKQIEEMKSKQLCESRGFSGLHLEKPKFFFQIMENVRWTSGQNFLEKSVHLPSKFLQHVNY